MLKSRKFLNQVTGTLALIGGLAILTTPSLLQAGLLHVLASAVKKAEPDNELASLLKQAAPQHNAPATQADEFDYQANMSAENTEFNAPELDDAFLNSALDFDENDLATTENALDAELNKAATETTPGSNASLEAEDDNDTAGGLQSKFAQDLMRKMELELKKEFDSGLSPEEESELAQLATTLEGSSLS